jgi:hypothetical protein
MTNEWVVSLYQNVDAGECIVHLVARELACIERRLDLDLGLVP